MVSGYPSLEAMTSTSWNAVVRREKLTRLRELGINPYPACDILGINPKS